MKKMSIAVSLVDSAMDMQWQLSKDTRNGSQIGRHLVDECCHLSAGI
jgi:hypothetical protein